MRVRECERYIKRKATNSIKERLTPEALKDLYLIKEMSLGDISKQYNCSRAYISKLCRLFNIPVRDKFKARSLASKRGKLVFDYHRVNERFFKTWSKEMAYVLGLLYADGNMNKNLRSFSLSLKEKTYLEYIKTLLASTHLITKNKVQELYHLHIWSVKMVEDLLNLGLIPRKSLKIKFPNIPNTYISHFIRGYFDGDGSVYKAKRNNAYIIDIITGSKDFILSIKANLERFAGVSAQRIHKRKTANAYHIKYQRRSDIERLYKYFYDEYTRNKKLHLPRKFLKFQEAINSYKSWTINQLMSSRYSAKAKMEEIQTNDSTGKLIAYWQSHRHTDANIADLAKYTSVSRDTAYRWLNRKAKPKKPKLRLIQDWLNQRQI